MRVSAVLLVLAVLSGCHGRSIPPMDFLSGSIFQDPIQKGAELMEKIKNNEELQTLFQELSTAGREMEDVVVPSVQRARERLDRDAQIMVAKLKENIGEILERGGRYNTELQTVMNVEDLRGRLSTYNRKLRKHLNKDLEDIKRRFSDFVEEVQTRLAGNAEEMRHQLQPQLRTVEDRISPIRDWLETKVNTMVEGLQSIGEDITANFQRTTDQLKTMLESP